MIEIKDLGFSYGVNWVLKNITMNLEEGRIYGLLGENGVGKTTLLTLLCGLKDASRGSITIDGRKPFDRSPLMLEEIFYLQEASSPKPVVADEYAAENGKFWKNFSMDKFHELMKEFETDPAKKMNKMSAGQLKKTYISFALACNCKYIFMDEPTNGLDIPSKTQFRKAIMKYTADDSVIVISTHQVRDLENIIDPIIILDKQDVLLNASVEEIESKIYFDYGTEVKPDALWTESVPGGLIQVLPNTDGEQSKINVEALFNAVHCNKETIKNIFK